MSAAAAAAVIVAAAVVAAKAVATPAKEYDEDEDDPQTGITIVVAHIDISILPLRRQLNIFPLTARREFVRAFSQGKAFCRFLHYIMQRLCAVLPRTMKGAPSV